MRVESQSRSIPMTGSVVIKHMPSQVTLLMNESSTSIDKLWLFVQLPLDSVAEKEQHSCNHPRHVQLQLYCTTYIQMHTHTHTHTRTHKCMHACTYTHTRAHTNTYTLHNTITHVRTQANTLEQGLQGTFQYYVTTLQYTLLIITDMLYYSM